VRQYAECPVLNPTLGPKKLKNWAKKYTLEHCEELLRTDPEACDHLYRLTHEQPIKRRYALRKTVADAAD